MEKENKFEWEQFCRLGDMIGEGLHYEEPWISKEYKRLQKILLPETKEEKEFKKKLRQQKNESINKQISEKLLKDTCKCGGNLEQTRSGSKTVKCVKCGKKYRYKSKNK